MEFYCKSPVLHKYCKTFTFSYLQTLVFLCIKSTLVISNHNKQYLKIDSASTQHRSSSREKNPVVYCLLPAVRSQGSMGQTNLPHCKQSGWQSRGVFESDTSTKVLKHSMSRTVASQKNSDHLQDPAEHIYHE